MHNTAQDCHMPPMVPTLLPRSHDHWCSIHTCSPLHYAVLWNNLLCVGCAALLYCSVSKTWLPMCVIRHSPVCGPSHCGSVCVCVCVCV